jgi:hypothetical protein
MNRLEIIKSVTKTKVIYDLGPQLTAMEIFASGFAKWIDDNLYTQTEEDVWIAIVNNQVTKQQKWTTAELIDEFEKVQP